MLSLTAEITIWYCFICTPGMQWLLEKSENELPTETLAKATRTGQTVQSSPKGNEDRKRGLGSSDVPGQVSVKGPSTSMSPRSDRGILAAI